MLNGKRSNAFPPEIRNKARMFAPNSPTQHWAGSYIERNKARKESKKQTDQKGRNKAAFKCK